MGVDCPGPWMPTHVHAGCVRPQWLASVCALVFQTIYFLVVQCIAGNVAVHVQLRPF